MPTRQPLNPNAGEFRPSVLGTRDGASLPTSPRSGPLYYEQKADQNEGKTQQTELPYHHGADNSLPQSCFTFIAQSVMECRAAFYEHPEAPRWKQLNFERFLRRCFFAAHESNTLCVTARSKIDTDGPFWVVSADFIALAHDVVLTLEEKPIASSPNEKSDVCGQNHSSTSTLSGVDGHHHHHNFQRCCCSKNDTRKNKNDSNSARSDDNGNGGNAATRATLCDLYHRSVRLIVPHCLRQQLASCARCGDGPPSMSDIYDAVMYSLDILFFFSRFVLLPLLDELTGASYAACVQTLTQMRERMLHPTVSSSFLRSALLLMLLAAHFQFRIENATAHVSTTKANSVHAQWLFCAYFAPLVVAFLSASPEQSIEELRNALVSSHREDTLPVLRCCSVGAMTVRELFGGGHQTARLWTAITSDTVAFAQRHMAETRQRVPKDLSKKPVFILSVPAASETFLHVENATVLGCLLDGYSDPRGVYERNAAEREDVKEDTNNENDSNALPSTKFYIQTLRAAAASKLVRDETVYFCLIALANLGAEFTSGLVLLFDALEKAYGTANRPEVMDAVLWLHSPASCASLGTVARELLDVLCALMKTEEPAHLLAMAEARAAIERRTQTSLLDGIAVK